MTVFKGDDAIREQVNSNVQPLGSDNDDAINDAINRLFDILSALNHEAFALDFRKKQILTRDAGTVRLA